MCQARQRSLNYHGVWFYAPLGGYHEHGKGRYKKEKKKKKNGGGQQRLDAICLLPSAVADGDGKRALCSALEDETLAERLMLVFL